MDVAFNPWAKQIYYSKKEIDLMCVQELKKADCLPQEIEPVRIDRFIEKHYTGIRYDDLGEGVLGCTSFLPTGRIEAVIISSRLDDNRVPSERRLRATLAHEAGHCMLHASLFLQPSSLGLWGAPRDRKNKKKQIVCRQESIAVVDEGCRRKYQWQEYQANCAIGGFLLPQLIFKEAIGRYSRISPITKIPRLTSDPNVREKIARDLSDVFEVNPIVVRIRIQETFPSDEGQETF